MSWDRIEGNWKHVGTIVIQRWGRLTDGDIAFVAGKREQLSARIQERYGIGSEEAERQIDDWLRFDRETGMEPAAGAGERAAGPPAGR